MTEREAAAASARPLPPLPEPAETALVQGCAMQGGEYRTLSLDYEEWTARYSVRHMRAYARAASAPQAVRRPLTEEQILRTPLDWTGDCDAKIAFARAIEAAHGIVPLAPQDTGEK